MSQIRDKFESIMSDLMNKSYTWEGTIKQFKDYAWEQRTEFSDWLLVNFGQSFVDSYLPALAGILMHNRRTWATVRKDLVSIRKSGRIFLNVVEAQNDPQRF